jgi:hypothetical protein
MLDALNDRLLKCFAGTLEEWLSACKYDVNALNENRPLQCFLY